MFERVKLAVELFKAEYKRRMGSAAADTTGLIGAIVAVIVGIAVAAYVVGAVFNAMPQITNSALNESIQNLIAQTGGVFNLLVIVPIVVVASFVLWLFRSHWGGA